ncbi:outer membrane beta-barrel protein [Helicobacter pylori]|nr:outer membrane beta-barrel protein [Helicobacter pylori]
MKKHILSLTLGSLLVSALSAEDDGFYMSAGYQIGEAAQMVKNTKGIQELSDNYEKLNNLLTKYSTLNTLIKLSSDPSAINGVRNDLGASAAGLLNDKKNSPAYQAVLLAINAAVGFWNVVGYVTQCGGNANSQKSTSSTTIFNNEPGYQSTSITCSLNGYAPGYYGPMSIENFKKLNEAYQILQTALKNGLPTLNQNNSTVDVTYSYTCSGERNNNCEIKLADGKDLKQVGGIGGSETTTQTIDGKQVSVTTKSWESASHTEITNELKGVPDSAQALLAQASTLINTINSACPFFHAPTSQANGPKWEWSSNKLCGAFSEEIGAIQKMITDAQEMVNQASVINSNEQTTPIGGSGGQPFNPFTDAKFADGMLANAQAQAKMINLADQVGNTINPEKISGNFRYFVEKYLATCNNPYGNGTYGTPPGTVTDNTFASGCAYVGETITALNNSIAHFGAQAEQIQQAEDLAYTLANFSSQYKKLGDTYNSITTAISSIPNAQAIQNVVSKKNNPYSPQGIQENFYLNQNTYNQVQTINQELGRNPFRKVGIVSSQTNNGAMNGIGIQVGYKQFFGQKRRWGARYYGFFDYNHAFIKSSFFNSASDVWTYGFGADALYNFINDKATNFLGKNNKLSVGLFGGIALAGTSWLNSEYVNLATVNNVYNAKMNVANFQFLFNMGVRMNLARPKKKDSDHVAQHGIELGLKIPTINTNYYSFMGAELKYRRLYSVYLNYVFAY